MNRYILIALVLVLVGHAGAAFDKSSEITTDKSEYKCGETVVISFDFIVKPPEEVIPRISIYQDPEFILHVITWDAESISGKQKWDTNGLWDGTYYIVLKYHRTIGLLYEEEIIAMSKFTLTSGAKHQQSLVSLITNMRQDFSRGDQPFLVPNIYNYQQQEVFSWSIFAS